MDTKPGVNFPKPSIIRPAPAPDIEQSSRRMYLAASRNLQEAQKTRRFSQTVDEAIRAHPAQGDSKTVKYLTWGNAAVNLVEGTRTATGNFVANGKYPKELIYLRETSRRISQFYFDLARSNRELSRATDAVKYFKSPAAASAKEFIKANISFLNQEIHHERTMYRAIDKSLGNYKRADRINKLIESGGEILASSRTGRNLLRGGKALGAAGKGIDAIGVVVAGIRAFGDSPNQTGSGRAVSAGLASTAQAAVSFGVKLKNPLVAVADLAVTPLVGEANNIDGFYQATARVYSALTGSITSGDSSALDRVHAMNMSTNGNVVFRGYAMIGEELANTGWLDGAAEWYGDWLHDVPEDFRESSSWRTAAETTFESVRATVTDAFDLGEKPAGGQADKAGASE